MIRPFRQPEVATGAQARAVPLRVVGCGYAEAADDSAGLEAIRRLRASGFAGGELIEVPQAGIRLMETLDGAEAVLFIDAVSSGAPPGTIHLLSLPSPELEARALGSLSSHGWGLAEVLRLRSALGRPSPRMLLVGIEIAGAVMGNARSREVEVAIRIVVERLPALCAIVKNAAKSAQVIPSRFPPGDASFPCRNGDECIAAGGW